MILCEPPIIDISKSFSYISLASISCCFGNTGILATYSNNHNLSRVINRFGFGFILLKCTSILLNLHSINILIFLTKTWFLYFYNCIIILSILYYYCNFIYILTMETFWFFSGCLFALTACEINLNSKLLCYCYCLFN